MYVRGLVHNNTDGSDVIQIVLRDATSYLLSRFRHASSTSFHLEQLIEPHLSPSLSQSHLFIHVYANPSFRLKSS